MMLLDEHNPYIFDEFFTDAIQLMWDEEISFNFMYF